MKIEDQVCTIEQAKKLKELGVVQESLFQWVLGLDKYVKDLFYITFSEECTLPHENAFSAFSVAELGVAVGSGYYTYNGQNGLEWVCYNKHDVFIVNGERFPTEAQARAALLIHLIENKTLKVDEVNKRLEA